MLHLYYLFSNHSILLHLDIKPYLDSIFPNIYFWQLHNPLWSPELLLLSLFVSLKDVILFYSVFSFYFIYTCLHCILPYCFCREEVAVAQLDAAAVIGEPMDINTALPLVIRKSKAHSGLAWALHEAAKAIEKHNAHLCVIADDCDQPDYVKLVKALCADHNVKMLRAPSAKALGEWAGVSKFSSLSYWARIIYLLLMQPNWKSHNPLL